MVGSEDRTSKMVTEVTPAKQAVHSKKKLRKPAPYIPVGPGPALRSTRE